MQIIANNINLEFPLSSFAFFGRVNWFRLDTVQLLHCVKSCQLIVFHFHCWKLIFHLPTISLWNTTILVYYLSVWDQRTFVCHFTMERLSPKQCLQIIELNYENKIQQREKEENIEHLLCHCPAYNRKKDIIEKLLSNQFIGYCEFWYNAIYKFVSLSKWFCHGELMKI